LEVFKVYTIPARSPTEPRSGTYHIGWCDHGEWYDHIGKFTQTGA